MEHETRKQHTNPPSVPPLTTAEKEAMRKEMMSFLDTHTTQPSAQKMLFTQRIRNLRFVSPIPSYALAGILVATTFTLGISEFSLPNDSLYAIKTGVNERIFLASTSYSPTLHARANHTVLARRLDEVERLMLLNEYDPETADTLQAKIAAQEAALEATIVEIESIDTERASELRNDREETHTKYDAVLDLFALRKNVGDPAVIDMYIEEATEEFSGTLRDELSAVEIARIEYAVMDHYAEQLLTEVEAVHKEISVLASANGRSYVTEEVRKSLGISNNARAEAEIALQNQNPEQALVALDASLRAAHDAITRIAERAETSS